MASLDTHSSNEIRMVLPNTNGGAVQELQPLTLDWDFPWMAPNPVQQVSPHCRAWQTGGDFSAAQQHQGPLYETVYQQGERPEDPREGLGELLDWSASARYNFCQTYLNPTGPDFTSTTTSQSATVMTATTTLPMEPYRIQWPKQEEGATTHPLEAADFPGTAGAGSPESCRLSLASSGYYSSLSPPSDLDAPYSPPLSTATGGVVSDGGSVGVASEGGAAAEEEQQRTSVAVTAATHDTRIKREPSETNHAHLPLSHAHVDTPQMDAAKDVKVTSSPATPTSVPEATSAAPATKPATGKKPAMSYVEMIARALLTGKDYKLILADIYADILQRFPYYETAPGTWRNAVRHNLCVNDCFIKAGRSNSGRGFFWAIHPACVDMFSKGDFRRTQARRLAQQMDLIKVKQPATVNHGPVPVATPSHAHHYSVSQQQPTRMTTYNLLSYQATPYNAAPYQLGSHAHHMPPNAFPFYDNGHTSAGTGTCQSYYATPMYR